MFCSVPNCENAVTEISGPKGLVLCNEHKHTSPERLKALMPVENKMVQPVENKAVNATDAAIALASQHGIDLAGVQGSGADGRIVKADVVAVVASSPPEGS